MEEELNYSEIRKTFLKNYREIFIPFIKTVGKENVDIDTRFCGRFDYNLAIILTISFFAFLAFIIYIVPLINKNADINLALRILFCLYIPAFIFDAVLISGKMDRVEKVLKYKNRLKDIIMPKLMSCVNLNWSRERYNEQKLYRYGILFRQMVVNKKYYLEAFDDIITGMHNGVNFEIVERRIKTDNKGYLIITATFNNFFKSMTVIKGKKSLVQDWILPHKVLEGVFIEKNLNVYTNNENEAKCLINKSFTEILNTLKKAFGGELNGCVFFENKLHMVLNIKKDLFEPFLINSPNEDSEQFFSVLDEIISIFRLIDCMKLYLK